MRLSSDLHTCHVTQIHMKGLNSPTLTTEFRFQSSGKKNRKTGVLPTKGHLPIMSLHLQLRERTNRGLSHISLTMPQGQIQQTPSESHLNLLKHVK